MKSTFNKQDREFLRAALRGYYDLQKLRIMAGQRVVANFRVMVSEEALDDILGLEDPKKYTLAEKIHKVVKNEYDLLTTTLAKMKRANITQDLLYKETGIISGAAEYILVSNYMEMVEQEKILLKNISQLVEETELWQKFLVNEAGIGPILSAVILAEVDIDNTHSEASLWKYAGLDVGPDGKGRNRTKEHLVKRAYKDKKGKEQLRDSITFNPFFKTKMVGVLGSSLVKFRAKSVVGHYYDDYKARITAEEREGLTPGHINSMSERYLVKMFLRRLFRNWKRIRRGFEVGSKFKAVGLEGIYTVKGFTYTKSGNQYLIDSECGNQSFSINSDFITVINDEEEKGALGNRAA